ADIPVQNLSALLQNEDVPLRSMLKLLCTEIQPRNIREWVELCQQWAIALTAEPDAPPLLWQDDAGEALQKCLIELAAHSNHFPVMPMDGFMQLLLDQMQSITLHPHAVHPNLQILGPLEARLHHYDVVILGGLNEGIWPQTAPADPWLSRPMRKDMKLAVPEEMIALTAHDFYQLATQGKVYLTRAAFADGAPALPSRWWQRLTAYLQACQLNGDILEDRDLLARTENMHHADVIAPMPQPRPMPPAALCPRRYSPSAIECLMRNPYEFYAKYILGLYVLPDLGGEADEKEQGNLLHKIFAEFTDKYPAIMPADAAAWLDARAQEKMAAQNLPKTLHEFWWQNWLRARNNFMAWQADAIAQGRRVLKSEYELSHELPTSSGPVVLRARADRIDLDASGNFVIVDYKRKNAPSKSEAVNFKKPQLLIEAWLLAQCGMEGHTTRTIAHAEFWPLLQEQIIAPDIEKFAEATAQLPEELSKLLSPYLNGEKAFSARMPSNLFEDQKRYVQLSRADEWQGRAA
ncbi:MAG TPA: PD-(D/E)XK nuclease family protein, partial [Alphaproteobacteria bacterium]|nr:PD-(D/E)XK nuclease family protein [Alphaproteobacteria bacterium]